MPLHFPLCTRRGRLDPRTADVARAVRLIAWLIQRHLWASLPTHPPTRTPMVLAGVRASHIPPPNMSSVYAKRVMVGRDAPVTASCTQVHPCQPSHVCLAIPSTTTSSAVFLVAQVQYADATCVPQRVDQHRVQCHSCRRATRSDVAHGRCARPRPCPIWR